MKYWNLGPGMTIATVGLLGLVFGLADNSGKLFSKIPLVSFFFVLLIGGLLLAATSKDRVNDTFGEVEAKQGFG